VIWLFWSGSTGWGIALAVCTVFVTVIDNVLKPLLIKRGVDLPLLLLIAGVIGGLISFGVVGLFIGPVILAVTYTLLVAWVRGENAPPAH
jgi:predicted PurR-regulated permease PerM